MRGISRKLRIELTRKDEGMYVYVCTFVVSLIKLLLNYNKYAPNHM